MSDEILEFAAESMQLIELYFYGKLGLSLRSSLKLPFLKYPRSADEAVGGYSLGTATFEGRENLALIDAEGRAIALTTSGKIRDGGVGLSLLLSRIKCGGHQVLVLEPFRDSRCSRVGRISDRCSTVCLMEPMRTGAGQAASSDDSRRHHPQVGQRRAGGRRVARRDLLPPVGTISVAELIKNGVLE
jgi:hypothetical protein